MMRLFYTPATSSLFPHIVLNEAGLTFEKTKVDEHTKLMETGEDYRTINPLGFVPALRLDDGTVLTEGTAIVQYIADQVPTKESKFRPNEHGAPRYSSLAPVATDKTTAPEVRLVHGL
jgi:glutathione S-transferase